MPAMQTKIIKDDRHGDQINFSRGHRLAVARALVCLMGGVPACVRRRLTRHAKSQRQAPTPIKRGDVQSPGRLDVRHDVVVLHPDGREHDFFAAFERGQKARVRHAKLHRHV